MDTAPLWQWRLLITCCLWSTDCPAVVSRAFWTLQLQRKVPVEVRRCLFLKQYVLTGCVVAHHNLGSLKAEAGGFWVEGQTGLHSEALSENKYTGQMLCYLITKMIGDDKSSLFRGPEEQYDTAYHIWVAQPKLMVSELPSHLWAKSNPEMNTYSALAIPWPFSRCVIDGRAFYSPLCLVRLAS